MSGILWIRTPSIWEAVGKRAAKVYPKWTKAWWREVAKLYEAAGGRYEEPEDTDVTSE